MPACSLCGQNTANGGPLVLSGSTECQICGRLTSGVPPSPPPSSSRTFTGQQTFLQAAPGEVPLEVLGRADNAFNDVLFEVVSQRNPRSLVIYDGCGLITPGYLAAINPITNTSLINNIGFMIGAVSDLGAGAPVFASSVQHGVGGIHFWFQDDASSNTAGFIIDGSQSPVLRWGAGSAAAALDTTLERVAPGILAVGNQVQRAIATPTYSASITPDASKGPWQTITVTNGTAFTINAPTNPPSSSRTTELTIEVLNSSGGAMGAITWNGAFVFATGAWTNPANTKKRFARFEWNGSNWLCTSLAASDY